MSKSNSPSYKSLKDELDQVMAKFQDEDLDIDEAIQMYKRGLELVKELEIYLKEAENTVKELKSKLKSSD